ncbi:microtubule-associated protein tau isoform X2 [Colletes gigas]|uniref:microtubule-associated protein tau isoform X2 n=1 Tax=Colletes gigas TaxID=935657 RepID=UPI001C9B1114|nr:microtubule-associated protein tau isoform X2 [Colletes gigas]
MADGDNAKKLKQSESTAFKEMRENAENDDDDDVVIDSNKSPSVDASKREELIVSKSPDKNNIIQSTKKPESATINGKVDFKDVSAKDLARYPAMEKLYGNINDPAWNRVLDKPETNTVESVKNDSRLFSPKHDENTRTDSKSEQSMDKTIESKSASDNADSFKEFKGKTDSTNDKSNRLDASAPDEGNSRAKSPNKAREEEQKLTASSKSPEKSHTLLEEKKTPSKSAEDSRETVLEEMNRSKGEQESKTLSKSADKSRVDDRVGNGKIESEQESKVAPKSPNKSRESSMEETNRFNGEQEPKTPPKSADKSRVEAEARVGNTETKSKQESKVALKSPNKSRVEADDRVGNGKIESEQESKVAPKSPNKSRESPMEETNRSNGVQEPKTPPKSADKSRVEAEDRVENTETESKQESKVALKSPNKSRVEADDRVGNGKIENEQESKVASKSPNKSSEGPLEETNRSNGVQEPKTPPKSADKSRVEAEARVGNSETESEQESKSPNKLPASTLIETNQVIKHEESKDSTINVAVPVETSEMKQKLNATSVDPDKSSTKDLTEQKSKDIPNLSESNRPVIEEKKVGESPSKDVRRDTPAQNNVEPKTVGTTGDSSNVAKEDNLSKSPTPSDSQKPLSLEKSATPSESSAQSVKGFDNGQKRSLSTPETPVSPKSPTGSVKLANEEKKTVVEDSIDETKDDDKKTHDLKIPLKSSTPNIQKSPSAAEMDKKSEKKFTETPGIQNGNAIDESVQSNMVSVTNGVEDSPTKQSLSKSKEIDKKSNAGSPVKSPSKSIKSLPRTPETPSSTTGQDKKKLPMNKVQVGSAPSPNLKTVRSKIGSLENASYKPGGGKVKIENRKLDFSKAQPKIAAKNEKYTPSGGDKKIAQVKLQWNAKPKVGSLENATYRPGGGDKKIETVKVDFKDKAKPKVGSKDNAKHIPGGGSVKIQTQKIDIKAESKIGSLDNVKHKPGGGDKKIFNDKDYLRQTGSNVESLSGSGSQSPVPPGTIIGDKNDLPTSDENLNQEC